MTKSLRLLLALLLAGIFCFDANAQDKYWSSHDQSKPIAATDKAVARLSFPKEFKLFDLDLAALRNDLFTIVGPSRSNTSTIISIPNADGRMEQFQVYEASNFEPDLQARFPEIRAFSGKGITDRYATLKLSISPQGIQTMVFRTEKQNEFIEPYSQDHHTYAVFLSQRDKGSLPWTCSTDEQNTYRELNRGLPHNPDANNGVLKTMRLAQSCNGEYSNWFGAFNASQVGLVLAAFNATLTRCNGCYEKDLAVHLNLIANTTQVIFYDPATDPYTTLSQWNLQLQQTLTNIIGSPNYDIGHMFGQSGGGGNAGCIGCVCVDPATPTSVAKGGGITSPADGIPMGDNFDIDYVVHEVGHQLGANHTFSHTTEGTGRNKEVGAGITIMGYAGITAYDPAPHSIDIFHETSIEQIQANLATKTCPVTTSLAGVNTKPVIAPLSNYTIPISTPFYLTGSATDAENDPITYCWEQDNDGAGQTGPNSVAYAAKPTGPNWISFSPSTSGTRYMPRLQTILAGLLITPTLGGDAICNVEALSNVSRTLNFRLTARDNHPYSSTPPLAVGQTEFADMVVTVTNTAGPFQITAPNTAVTWNAGSTQTVTWLVNGTNTGVVNCANVKISLSTDGGQTFPTVLLASTANDGSETITVPNVVTTTARIKVEAIGNIFFDINDVNFTISVPTGFNFNPTTPAASACPAGSTMNITLGTTPFGGFSTPINLTASGFPAGTTVSFSPNPLTPGSSTVVTLNNANTLSVGTYPIIVTGTAGSVVQTANLSYVVNPGVGPAISQQPANTTTCQNSPVTFTVTSTGAFSYQWQKSTDGGSTWTNISGAINNSYSINSTQPTDAALYRVVITGQCGVTNSNAAILTVNPVPIITTQPAASALCAGGNTSYTVAATGTGTIYQWQVSTDGGTTWTNISNGGIYSGATTATLTLTGTPVTVNNNRYRVLLSNALCTTPTVSGSALATVHALPTITLNSTAATLLPGQLATLTATPVSSGGVVTTTWTLNGSPLIVSNNVYVANVEHLGAYQVGIAETWAGNLTCTNISSIVTINTASSDRLFIFPSPNDGRFTVSYYNNGGATSSRRLVIFSTAGQKVYDRLLPITGPYTLMNIDLHGAGRGIYYVVLGDASGNKLAEGKVHVR